MKKYLLALLILMTTNVVAQEIEAVDSINLGTGIIYPANDGVVVDTICTNTLDVSNPPVPQIPLDQCDSLMVGKEGDK